jgi:predicted DNA-binding transcriptional regulator AlpA
MSVNDIAHLLNLGRTATYQLVRESHFPKPYTINARCLRWERLEVNAWLLSRREVVSPVRQIRRPTSGRIIVNGVTFVGGKR